MEQFAAGQISAPVRTTNRRAATGTARGASQQAQPQTVYGKMEQQAQGVSSFVNLPWMINILALPSFALRKVGLKKFSGHLRAAAHGLVEPLQATQLSDATKLPGRIMDVAADQYHITGHSEKRVDGIRRMGAGANEAMGKLQKNHIENLTDKGGKLIDRMTEGKSGGFLSRSLDKLATMREKVNMRKSLSTQMMEKLGKAVEGHDGAFRSLSGHASRNLEHMSAKARVAHFEGIAERATAVFRNGSHSYETKFAAEEIVRMANKSAKHAQAALAHGEAAGKGLNVLVKNAMRMGGRGSLMGWLLGAGAVAASTAAYFGARNLNTLEEQTIKSMTADIGDTNNPYLQTIKKGFKSDKRGHWINAAATAAGEVTMATTMSAAGGSGMAMNMGAVAIPMLGQTLVKDNPALNAYANLQQAERGEAQVSPAEKAAQVRHLVGMVPSVLPHGGYYNRLCQPIAEKIVADKLSLRETMQLVSDPQRFVAYASEVKAAQAAAHAPKRKDLTNDGVNEHAETMMDYADEAMEHKKEVHQRQQAEKFVAQRAQHQAAAAVPANDHAANDNHAPMVEAASMKVQASQLEHDGTVAERQMAAAQNA